MPSPISTTLDVLLLAAENRLIANAGFSSNTCFISLNPDQSLYQPSDQYTVITPGPQKVSQPIVVGAGQNLVYFEGSFIVTLWSRLQLDQVPRDDSYLTDVNLGAIKTTNVIIDALHLYQPLDDSGNQLVAVPYILDGIESYSRDMKGVGWGALKLKFRIEFSQVFSS